MNIARFLWLAGSLIGLLVGLGTMADAHWLMPTRQPDTIHDLWVLKMIGGVLISGYGLVLFEEYRKPGSWLPA